MACFTAALAFGVQGWARIKTSMFLTTYKSAVMIKFNLDVSGDWEKSVGLS